MKAKLVPLTVVAVTLTTGLLLAADAPQWLRLPFALVFVLWCPGAAWAHRPYTGSVWSSLPLSIGVSIGLVVIVGETMALAHAWNTFLGYGFLALVALIGSARQWRGRAVEDQHAARDPLRIWVMSQMRSSGEPTTVAPPLEDAATVPPTLPMGVTKPNPSRDASIGPVSDVPETIPMALPVIADAAESRSAKTTAGVSEVARASDTEQPPEAPAAQEESAVVAADEAAEIEKAEDVAPGDQVPATVSLALNAARVALQQTTFGVLPLVPMPGHPLGRTGVEVGVVGLACGQFGGEADPAIDFRAFGVMNAATAAGVTFFDTGDRRGEGRSERLIARFRALQPARKVVVATHLPRVTATSPSSAASALRVWVDRSRANLGVDTLDLAQLHLPSVQAQAYDVFFDALDELVSEGRIASYGVSVATCAEALAAIARQGVATVQIVVNVLRLKPLEEVLPAAREAGVGIIARAPLESGILSGIYEHAGRIHADGHTTSNRPGEGVDIGSAIAGVPSEIGAEAVRELADAVPEGFSLAAFALRWVMDQPGISVVLPGTRSAVHARANAEAAIMTPLTGEQRDAVRRVYDTYVRRFVDSRC